MNKTKAVFLATAISVPLASMAETLTESQLLQVDDGAMDALFGTSVAIDKDTAFVGAVGDETAPGDTGSVYVFARNRVGTWVQQAKLLASQPTSSGDRMFGASVDVSGDTVIVGGTSDLKAEVHIFVRDGEDQWKQQARFVKGFVEYVETAVALDGDTAIVGAALSSPYVELHATGAAYVYTRTGEEWVAYWKPLASIDLLMLDEFGRSVDIHGDTAVVGAPYQGPWSKGAAYVFVRDDNGDWVKQTKLQASDGSSGDGFGLAVSIYEDRVVVGAPGVDTPSGGAAYVFTRQGDQWTQAVKLTTNNADPLANFGCSVATDGQYILVGADSATLGDESVGVAYLFSRTDDGDWAQESELVASDPQSGGRFATSVALSENTAIVGSPESDSLSLQDTGSAYVYFPLYQGDFDDVAPDYWAFEFIETLSALGISVGCGDNHFCPEHSVTRAQVAVLIERGIKGGDYVPPAAMGNVFLDVSATSFAAAFIEQLFADGITGGCGNHNFCPNDVATRAQVAVLLLRAKYGANYVPPPATGQFNDVQIGSFAAGWIEQLAAEGITVGCGNGSYCPEAPVTRAQMAVFLVRTFGLQ